MGNDRSPVVADIDAQSAVQARIWRVSRIAWWGMGAVLVLAAAGLFGDGPLATAEAKAGDGSVDVTFDRFQRADASSPFEVRSRGSHADGTLVLCLDRGFREVWRMERMEPAPVREEAQGGDVCHVIAVAPGAAAPVVVRFWAHAQMASVSAEGRLRVAGGEKLRLRTLVWP